LAVEPGRTTTLKNGNEAIAIIADKEPTNLVTLEYRDQNGDLQWQDFNTNLDYFETSQVGDEVVVNVHPACPRT